MNAEDNTQPYLVVIGASAGGLEPIQTFISECGVNKQAAFVVIQHLSADYKSMMRELLARGTDMPIQTVEDGMPVVPGHIYLIPPTHNIYLKDRNYFGLAGKETSGVNLPINIFLASAAERYGKKLVAVVLSGTGTDGTRGITAVNAAGGLSLAQSPETAQFDGMPASALATNCVDDNGDPEYLAMRVLEHLEHSQDRSSISYVRLETEADNIEAEVTLTDVLEELKERTGNPFDKYKKTTTARRVDRRMALCKMVSLQDYLKLLREDSRELNTLARDILIGVTSFFRDPALIEILQQTLQAELLKRETGQEYRVWVAGCSTGEEAYTIAMLLSELMDQLDKRLIVKIFATDLEQSYLDVAPAGTYPASIVAELSPERLKRFFSRFGEAYRINQDIRKMVIFARHNMITDAPFTRLDLLSCRNTLIYFEQDLQKAVLRRFQYALNPDGVMFLGSSESLGSLHREFDVISSSAKVYRSLHRGAFSDDRLRALTQP
ncbi:MAG: CheR family methyltransferase, partial [Halieaceae bacterium]|nr:CheR family methyltransferase [Halieaceae bacterium]